MSSRLLCDRPYANTVDFETSRFVVSVSGGLAIGDRLVKQGEEVPRGILASRAIRQEYELGRIQLFSYAKTDPLLSEACALAGVDLDAKPALRPRRSAISDELDALNRKELAQMCEKYGLSPDGTKVELRDRLAAVVG